MKVSWRQPESSACYKARQYKFTVERTAVGLVFFSKEPQAREQHHRPLSHHRAIVLIEPRKRCRLQTSLLFYQMCFCSHFLYLISQKRSWTVIAIFDSITKRFFFKSKQKWQNNTACEFQFIFYRSASKIGLNANHFSSFTLPWTLQFSAAWTFRLK